MKTSRDQPSPLASRTYYRSTLCLIFTAILVVSLICLALYWREADQVEKSILDREAKRTEIFAHFYERDLQAVFTNLKQLVDGDGLQAFLLTGKQADLDRAIHRAWFVSRLNPDYDQVRYLDSTGQEVIRINWNGQTVPRDQLQNKATRPYFQSARKLGPGQFYLSAFDLNIENGKIEQPLKPMLRVATPVTDGSGHLRGIYIINYLGEHILRRLQQFAPQYQNRLRLLNAQGYWIKAAHPEQEWGFMVPDRAGQTLAQTDPVLWNRLQNEPSGQIPYHGGYLSWYRVHPDGMALDPADVILAEDNFLIIASEISAEEWNAYFTGLRQTFCMVGLVLFLLVATALWFFQSRQRAQQERDRFFILTRDMLCIAGFDGCFKRINPAWEHTFGYARGELLNHPFIDFVHPDDRERTINETNRLREGHETISFENRYRCQDGSYRWLSWSARSLVGEQTIFASARDLTERKRIEEQILQLNEELKQRAAQLETANKELEAFSYSVSHDLRSPLRHIHGFVELLQKSPALRAEEASVRYMNVIARAARDMGLLIDDLLAFSRTGRAEMHPTPIAMGDLVRQVIGELEAETKDRKIVWDLQPLPKVKGDSPLLRLVWTNLIANALKYTRPRDEARIEIGVLPSGAGTVRADEVAFYIRDNGVGFDMRYASKLFGVFQRLHRADQFEGTGIGLANVQRIVLRHGGRVWAESQLDAGATFFFSLPANLNPKSKHAENQTHPVGGR